MVAKRTVRLQRCIALSVAFTVRQLAMAAASHAYCSRESATLTVLSRTLRAHWSREPPAPGLRSWAWPSLIQ
jgi:hypothetical protein